MSRKFMPSSHQDAITVSREGKFQLSLSPAEVDKATSLIATALRMESLEVLPNHISNPPFVIRFFEDDQLALERKEEKGSVPFIWDEADDLINALKDGMKLVLNDRRHFKGKRGTGYVPFNEEPFI